MRVSLQSVNRWLRFTGFRLAIYYEMPDPGAGPLGFALRWFGWRNFGGWDCRPWVRIDGAWVNRFETTDPALDSRVQVCP